MSGHTRPLTTKEVNLAAEWERQGYSHREIAALLSRPCHRTIEKHLRRRGPNPHGPRDGLPGREQEVCDLHALGLYVSQIARRLKVSHHTARNWLRRLGLSAPDGRRTAGGRTHTSDELERMVIGQEDRRRERCAELGWPEVSRPIHARILAALATAGVPLTHQQIAAALGRRTSPRRGGQPICPDLARRIRELCTPLRAQRGQGLVLLIRGPGPRVTYAVAPWLLLRRQEGATG